MAKTYDKETIYRDALQRNIADKNKKLVSALGKLYGKNGAEYSQAFGKILKGFCGNNDRIFRQLNDIVEKHSEKKFSAYNYFDLKTLYAYDRYLEELISRLSEKYRGMMTVKDFDSALNGTLSHFNEHAGKSKSNYYDRARPISLMYWDSPAGKQLLPRRTMSKGDFIDKYHKEPLAVMSEVYDYFAERRISEKRAIREEIERVIDKETPTIDYMHNGVKISLRIDSVNSFVTESGRGVKLIKASGKEGTLFKTRYLDGRVYSGILFDMDGNPVSEDSGEVFYENEKTQDIINHIKERTGRVVFEAEEYTEDDQMTLF